MTTVPYIYIKMALYRDWFRRTRTLTSPSKGDKRHNDLQKILDKMAVAPERSYYAPTMIVMNAFEDVKFIEKSRPRDRRPDWWSGILKGVFIVIVDGYAFAGQLRYTLTTGLRSKSEDAEMKQINDFLNYMLTFQNTHGNIAVHSQVALNYGRHVNTFKILVEEWEELKDRFTEEEKDYILAHKWVDILDES